MFLNNWSDNTVEVVQSVYTEKRLLRQTKLFKQSSLPFEGSRSATGNFISYLSVRNYIGSIQSFSGKDWSRLFSRSFALGDSVWPSFIRRASFLNMVILPCTTQPAEYRWRWVKCNWLVQCTRQSCVKKSSLQTTRLDVIRTLADVSRDKVRELTAGLRGIVRMWITLEKSTAKVTLTDRDKRNYNKNAIISRESRDK